MEKIFIITAFFLGFTGSLHCLCMCGPINFILFSNKKKKYNLIIKSLVYQIGRLTSYIILGIIFGLLGKTFSLIGVHKIISILLGISIIFYILYPNIKIRILFINKYYITFSSFIQKKIIFFIKNNNIFSSFIIGILNGLLPCGLLYLAITTSISMGDIIYGMFFMLFFGIGTIPIMMFSSFLGMLFKLNLLNNNIIKYINPIFILIISVLLFLRGLGLGIPYISPLDNDIIPKKNININQTNHFNCR